MQDLPEIVPHEGRHVLHLFFRVEYSLWDVLDHPGRIAAKTALAELVQEIRATPATQLLLLSMVSPKADLGFVLVTPDLQAADAFAKRLTLALGPDVLSPAFSWLSVTERSEYTTGEEEYSRTLEETEKLTPGSSEHAEKMEAFRTRMAKYLRDRLEPNLPDWPVVCFYPMSKRRAPGQNWYALDFAARKALMGGHARVGRTYAGRVLQLITGSTGLDDGEWGVTLFARTTSEIKAIVYEMRFDEVSAQYADFGEFFIGIQMPLDALYARLML
ncbi:MAG: chlorite dismutase family protein [Terrimicrobiaceae bacterium]|nr:chlorite dismutase family protein [Terrimicrobiaceae bacterium]